MQLNETKYVCHFSKFTERVIVMKNVLSMDAWFEVVISEFIISNCVHSW